MAKVIEFFLKRSLLVNILLVAIFLLAAYSAYKTNRNAYPEVDLAKMVITTEYPGASPKDVEQNVTRLIEDELKGIAGIDKFTSVSSENVSFITVEIDIDYPDPKEVKDEVRRAVERVSDLPTEVEEKPVVRDLKSSELPVLVIGVSGEVEYSLLRQMAKVIERDLRNLKGVAKVDEYAYRDYEFQVELDPKKLSDYTIAINDILYSIENRNVRSTGGSLESFKTQRNILTLSEFEDVDQVRNVIVRSSFGGGALILDDIGEVSEGFEDEKMRTIFNGERGISLVVKKASNTDILRLVERLKEYVIEKQKVMPEGVHLTAVNDASIKVRNRLQIVIYNGILGFILVTAVIIFFLNLRASFWIAMSIPAAFAVSLIVLPFFGVDLNAITLAAMILVLGMLVDDSIVVAENIFYHRRFSPPFEAALNGTREVMVPVVGTVLTTVCAFAPIFAMTGIMGRFVYVIPVVIIAALIGSLLDCFLILPNHLYHSSAKIDVAESGWRSRMFAAIANPYRKSMKVVLKMRYLAVGFSLLLLVFTLWWGKEKVGFNLFPPDGAQIFYLFLELEEDKNFNATEEVVHKLEEVIQEIPKEELESYYGRIGTQEAESLATPVGGEENMAYLQVMLTQFSERDRDVETIMEEVREKTKHVVALPEVKELRFEIEKPGPPAGKPITFHVHSDIDQERQYFVDKIVKELEGMSGISDINTTSKVGREEYKLNLDYQKLASAGLTVNDVASTLRVAFDGVDTTSVVRDNEEVKIRVRFPKKERQDVNNILNLQIRNSDGKLIPIWAFANLGQVRADTAIHHTDGDVTTTIYAQTDVGRNPKKIIDQLVEKFSPELADYPQVSFSYGGEAEKTEESMRSLFIAFAGGVIAIYLILTLLFNSLSQPLLILVAVPFGLIGVTWAFYAHGIPYSFMGLIGIVGLSGVVVNASLIMVDLINKLVREKFPTGLPHARDLYETVIEGSTRRLRPIIITTITTVMGLLPTAYGIGGSDPFISPMVIAVAYGLIFATVLTLYFVPSLYLINQDVVLLCANMFQRLKSLLRRRE